MNPVKKALLHTSPKDDSDSNLDWFRYHFLMQAQYRRFLESLYGYCRAAYDSVQLPDSGIGYANEISPLSTVFPGLYPFETINPSFEVFDKAKDPPSSSVDGQEQFPSETSDSSFEIRPPKYLDKAEKPSPSSIGEQAAHATNTVSVFNPHTLNNTADMLTNAKDLTITGGQFENTSTTHYWSISIKVSISFLVFSLVLCSVAYVLSLYGGRTDGLSSFLHRCQSLIAGDPMYGLGRLEQFVSFKAINGSSVHDPKCQVHEGTRERVLSQIKGWIDNPDETERVMWLHGPAGIGKSAIAQTIMNSYTSKEIPANFVFFSQDLDRSDGKRLFTTLAWQFASSIPDIKPHIARSLNEQPDLPTKNVETQFQELIVRPFEALGNHALSDMVVVIDGLDECEHERLQERILKVIGEVPTGVPLRFLIASRPEAHINKIINTFERHTLSIDLAECPDADRDIELYFKVKFEDIGKDQDVYPEKWPVQDVIDQLVQKASGQFIYASTVIKFVGSADDIAKTQLDIILGLKPRRPSMKQPYAELDDLYAEILKRQPDQEFLKTFLASFVAESSLSISRPFSHRAACSYPHLREGYGILMNVSEQDLRRKLCKMRSLLELSPDIGVHHRSFLEFLQDPSRSDKYNISTESAAGQHLILVIDSLLRSAPESLANEQPNYYPPVPELVEMFGTYPSSFENVLSREDWREALRPLLDVRERLFNWKVPRNECTIFHVVHRVLLSISYRQLLRDEPEENDDAVISPVLKPKLPGGPSYFRRLMGIFDLMRTLLKVDPETIAVSVGSWSEAQNLMDLVCHIVNGKYLITSLFSADTVRKATQLALEIHTRVPVLPQSFLSTTFAAGRYFELGKCWSCDLGALGRAWLISNILDHRHILPLALRTSRTNVTSDHLTPAITLMSGNVGMSLSHWREEKNPSSNAIIFVMLELARAIQYLYSFGIVLSDNTGLDDIYVDSRSRIRISPLQLVWSIHGQPWQEESQTRYETNIYMFGDFFYTMYFDTELPCTTDTGAFPSKPESSVREDVWQLIQRCLSHEDKPSINEVVREMESWEFGHSFYRRYLPFM